MEGGSREGWRDGGKEGGKRERGWEERREGEVNSMMLHPHNTCAYTHRRYTQAHPPTHSTHTYRHTQTNCINRYLPHKQTDTDEWTNTPGGGRGETGPSHKQTDTEGQTNTPGGGGEPGLPSGKVMTGTEVRWDFEDEA